MAMVESLSDKLITLIAERNIKDNNLIFIDKNKYQLTLSELEFKEITNINLLELRKKLNRPSINGELFIHRKNNILQYSWKTADKGIEIFGYCGSKSLSSESTYILSKLIPDKKNINLLGNNTDYVELWLKNDQCVNNGLFVFKDTYRNKTVYTAIENLTGACNIADFNSLRKAIIYLNHEYINESDINSFSEKEIFEKTQYFTEKEINQMDFELTRLNIHNNEITLLTDTELSTKLDLINWLNVNKPSYVSDFTIKEIDEIQSNLDNWKLNVNKKNVISLLDSNGKEKCSGLYNICSWFYNLSKEQRMFFEYSKDSENDLYTNFLLSEIHWQKRVFEFNNINYAHNMINLLPENTASSWLPRHNAKLIKKAVLENIAPFLPDDYGRINTKTIYNLKNGKCLPVEVLIPAQIKQIANKVDSNYMIPYSYILNNNIQLIPGSDNVFYNSNSKISTYVFPESIKKKRIEKKINKKCNFQNNENLSHLTQEITSSEPVEYLTAYNISCKTGMKLKVSKEISDDFINKLNEIIDNELLSGSARNTELMDLTTLFSSVEKKSISLIKNITSNELYTTFNKQKVRGYQRAREEITR